MGRRDADEYAVLCGRPGAEFALARRSRGIVLVDAVDFYRVVRTWSTETAARRVLRRYVAAGLVRQGRVARLVIPL